VAAEETDEPRPYCGAILPLVRNQQFPVQLLGCGSMSVPFQKDFRMSCGGKLEVSGGHRCVNEAMVSRVYRASLASARRFRGLLTTADLVPARRRHCHRELLDTDIVVFLWERTQKKSLQQWE
jgi:hypothetical protein